MFAILKYSQISTIIPCIKQKENSSSVLQYSRINTMDLDGPEFETCLWHLLALWIWTNFLTSLIFYCLTDKADIVIVFISCVVVSKVKYKLAYKTFNSQTQ